MATTGTRRRATNTRSAPAAKTGPKKRALDFSGVKEGGAFAPKRVPEGDYLAKITAVIEDVSQNDNDMWVYTIELPKRRGGRYPYHCTLTKESLWKVYNLFVAAGKNVPKKRLNVDPTSILECEIGVTMVDDEYEGREKSVIDSVFPAEDLDESATPEEDDEDLEEPPAQKTRSRTAFTRNSKRSAGAKTTTRRRGNRRSSVDEDDVTDEEMEELDVDEGDEDLDDEDLQEL